MLEHKDFEKVESFKTVASVLHLKPSKEEIAKRISEHAEFMGRAFRQAVK